MRAERMDALLSIRNLSFSYEAGEGRRDSETGTGGRGMKGRNVLDIDSIDIVSAGCYAILGPNGCGKTTLLKLIGNLLKPGSGTVSVQAKAVLVHQHPYLLSGTVFNNVAYGLRIKKLPKKDISVLVSAELDRWGLSHLKDRQSAKLSGGEKQRTAIARAMVLKPDILLLDEPTASVDPENISQMEDLIADVIRRGTTVILSTHHIDFAYRVADSIIRLNRGRLAEVHENIISGHLIGSDESFNFFEAEGTMLYCPGRDGDFRRAVFSSNDVILSKEDVKSSARNSLKAEIISIDKNGNEVIVKLKAGFTFRARISSVSAAELGIGAGQTIFALIKSSSIGLY
jgi:molybdopterin-binding protein